jgi:hypothetical protein
LSTTVADVRFAVCSTLITCPPARMQMENLPHSVTDVNRKQSSSLCILALPGVRADELQSTVVLWIGREL